jgi:putative ABC transport system substrate-binding protein
VRLRWNLRIDYYGHRGDLDQARVFAKELVSLAPDLILVRGSSTLAAVREETETIPIVFCGVADPVGQGFVANLAHQAATHHMKRGEARQRGMA